MIAAGHKKIDTNPRPAESSGSGENLSSTAEPRTFKADDFAFGSDNNVLNKASTSFLNFTKVSNEKLHEKLEESPHGGNHSHVPTSEIKACGSIHTLGNSPGKTSSFFLGDSYLQDWEPIKAALPETGFEDNTNPQHPQTSSKLERNTIENYRGMRKSTPRQHREKFPLFRGAANPGKQRGTRQSDYELNSRSPKIPETAEHHDKIGGLDPEQGSGISKSPQKHFLCKKRSFEGMGKVAELREKFEK
ncbi:hypothetical protein RUND412_002363 [Rhizina undulata]